MSKKYKIEYKLLKGDNYDKLSQRYGATLLANAGIFGDEDLISNSTITFSGLSEDELQTIQDKTQSYLDLYNRNRELRYIKQNRDYIDRENFWQGNNSYGKSDKELLSTYKGTVSAAKQEAKDRAIQAEKSRILALKSLDNAEHNARLRAQGVKNEETMRFSPEMRYHEGRKQLLESTENTHNPMLRGVTLNGNTDMSFENSVQNLEDLHKLTDEMKDLTHKAATGIVGLAGIGTLGTTFAPTIAKSAAAITDTIGTVAKPVVNSIWLGFKYNLQHPIESYIAPKLLNNSINKGYDIYENISGKEISDRIRNNTSAVSNMMITPLGFNVLRSGLGKFGPSFIDENSGLIKKYVFNALSNGLSGATFVGNTATNIFRHAAPSALGAGMYLGQDAILDGKTIGQNLKEKGVNKHVANGLNYLTNGLIYGTAMQAGNRLISKPINNINLLSQGAHNPSNAVLNVAKAPMSEIFVMNRPAMVPVKNKPGLFTSYQQIYTATPKQTELKWHRKIMPSYAFKGTPEEIMNNAIYYNTYVGNTIKPGLNIGAGHKVKAKIRRGSEANSDDFVLNTSSRIMNSADRFGKGQYAIVVERPGSIKLPGLAQMEKEGWMGLTTDIDGNLVSRPINKHFKAKMNGAREDWSTVREDGSSEMFNSNGYQTTVIRDPNGNLYHVKIDVGGTGSAGSGIISGVADSGMTPMLTYEVSPVAKDSNGKYIGAFNRKAANPGIKSSKKNLIKMLFSSKARKEFTQRSKDYNKSEESKLLNKKLQQENKLKKKSLQYDVDVMSNKQGGIIGFNSIGL